jgi:UDP-N-acetylglucosamine 2-epimerase (non-hydrolysing)
MIKLAGVAQLLAEQSVLVHSGQHWDDAMAGVFLRDLGLGVPCYKLAVGGMTRGEQIGEATTGLSRLFDDFRPVAVVVQGDTNSALAGALAANACDIPLVHVEAGLRSFDRAMPEEHNRVLIDHLSDLCCAPTDQSAVNLRAENIPDDRISVTGNTVVEAARRLLPGVDQRLQMLAKLGLERGRYVLATIHRPENTDGPALADVLTALAALPLPVVIPVHPRTSKRIEDLGLGPLVARLRVMTPLSYERFLGLLAECALCVSDSGGIQEEASVLGRPVVVVRRSTERPEVLGIWATLVSAGPAIGDAVGLLLADLPTIHARLEALPSPYGDGTASARTVDAIQTLIHARAPVGRRSR